MKDDLEQIVARLRNLDGTIHKSSRSNITWSAPSPLSPTKEEAMDQARADAIKRGKPFSERRGSDTDEADERAIEKYLDDLMGEIF